ncbi:hypothetical protein OG275_34495 [Streptomyces niveus]|uniref:hypothetical protein n=1 Tax=Streptomyces niveus TaxID=193462 RepID=UPI002E2FEE61|nr:hypothetical protein [Streptomyces niveus]
MRGTQGTEKHPLRLALGTGVEGEPSCLDRAIRNHGSKLSTCRLVIGAALHQPEHHLEMGSGSGRQGATAAVVSASGNPVAVL